MFESAALPFVASLLLSLLLVPIAIRLAPRFGFIDRPRPDRAHEIPTPHLGGAAIVLAVAGATAPWAPEIPRAIYAGGAVAAVLGLVDDRYPLPPWAKLAGQGIAAVILVIPMRGAWGPWVALGAVLWTVALLNATNFLDNQDAALSAAALPAALALGAMGLLSGSTLVTAGGFALAGALAGFLRFNRPPAAVFMGDVGSLAVGFVLATLALSLASRAGRSPHAFGPLLAVAYPLFDLVFVTVTRIATGRRIDRGGVDHTSHRLARTLGSVRHAAGAIGAVSFALAVTAVSTFAGGSWNSLALSGVIVVAFFAWMTAALLGKG